MIVISCILTTDIWYPANLLIKQTIYYIYGLWRITQWTQFDFDYSPLISHNYLCYCGYDWIIIIKVQYYFDCRIGWMHWYRGLLIMENTHVTTECTKRIL